jgi:hypothetical protein
MDTKVTAGDLAQAVSAAQQFSRSAARHEKEAAQRADEADQYADEAADHSQQAADHERVAAISAAKTLAHEQAAVVLLEQTRVEERETHQLRQEAHKLLVVTREHEHDAARALAQIQDKDGNVAQGDTDVSSSNEHGSGAQINATMRRTW